MPPADQDTKFSYLWNCRAWLDQATKVVIATGELDICRKAAEHSLAAGARSHTKQAGEFRISGHPRTCCRQ